MARTHCTKPAVRLTVEQLREKAQQWGALRVARGSQSYYQYQIGAEAPGVASLVAPPVWDQGAECAVSEHYQLDLVRGTCTCGDQAHIDRLYMDLWRAGLNWQSVGGQVVCKHHIIYALLVVRREEQEREAQARAERLAAQMATATIGARESSPMAQQISGSYWDEWEIDQRIAADRQAAERAEAERRRRIDLDFG